MSKEQLMSNVLEKFDQLGISYSKGQGTDISINCEFLDASWGTGKKSISYEAVIFFDERIQTVFMRELTKESGSGFSFGSSNESFSQTGSTLFRKVKSVQYSTDGKAYEYDLNLGEIPNSVKKSAKEYGWKFKTVLKKENAMYPPGYVSHPTANADTEPLGQITYCEGCGKSLPDNAAFCENCGKELSFGAGFCKYCGTAVKKIQENPVAQAERGRPAAKPKKKKGCLIALLSIVGIIVLLIAMAIANGGEISYSTAKLSEAVMASEVDPVTMKPVAKTDTFSAQTPVIYAAVLVRNAPDDTKISTKWTYIPENYEIIMLDFNTTEASQYVAFHVSKPDQGFPLGEYKVEFFLNDEPADVLNFSVK
ncbi:MAG TPA: zinc-ribbon domain-containing protein [Bacillota bacterium]|nr:zinc-ribbon domain-containing protein [Bacillota bacterium]